MTLITTRREKQRETLRDVPCWNQLRQREANSGFMMHEALKIAQGTMDTKGSLLAGEENPPVAKAGTHTHRKYPDNTRVSKNTGRGFRMS